MLAEPLISNGKLKELIKDSAIIIGVRDFRETSAIVSVITKSRGKLRLIAKGVRRKKPQLSGSLRIGSVGEVVYYYRQESTLHLLKEANFKESFYTDSLDRLCMLQAILELSELVALEGEGNEEFFELITRSIRYLNVGDPWYVFFVFEVGVLKLSGLYPELSKCDVCGIELSSSEEIFINPRGIEVYCMRCRGKDSLIVSRDSLKLIRNIERGESPGMEESGLEPIVKREVGKLLHYIFLYHVDGYRLPESLRLLGEVNKF